MFSYNDSRGLSGRNPTNTTNPSNRNTKLRNANSKQRGPKDPFENTNMPFVQPDTGLNGMMIGGSKAPVGSRGPNPLVPSS